MEYATTLHSVENLTSQNWLGADPNDAVETVPAGVHATAILLAMQAAERSKPSSCCCNLSWGQLEAAIQAAIEVGLEAERPDSLCS